MCFVWSFQTCDDTPNFKRFSFFVTQFERRDTQKSTQTNDQEAADITGE